MNALRAAVAVALLGLISACGFRLAGERSLPLALQTVHVDLIAPYRVSEPPLETSLRALLARRGADVRDKRGEGVTEIRVSNLNTVRETLSIGIDGKALEFALVTGADYEVRRDGRLLLATDHIDVVRDFSFNAEQVLAKEAEEERLRRYIQAEMAELILLRLEARLSAVAIDAPATPADESPAE
ncbi:LPS assembly lipoprotein LptE [Flagellatimonas centrodinii]|uniref:LPS-assembly lipoprotein LptE n=1 Tax=Flagellatimonas centrodinii TaxID=2806210 RepID=UPI001FEF1CAF|nr:LPS assembly lipoprotein LptE [Flagellatimonas centrodinii]ULQ46719.1 LPS assembly lipoprotein LptE [Flagellatimonas centrodinii]